MRKVKLAAMQPCTLPKGNAVEADEIFAQYIVPQLDVTLNMVRSAGETGCDMVTTSEDICAVSHYFTDPSGIFPELAKRSAAYAEEKLSALARTYGMYIAGCYFKPYDDGIHNVASIFSREGAIVGEYRKTHLPPNELWWVREGNTLPVFDLDFGRVGILICYDMMFPEAAQVLSLKGAEVVLHPTAGYGWYDAIGEATLKTRANDGNFHLVVSKNYIWNGAGKSGIIDYWGHIRAEAGFYENVTVVHEIDLDEPKRQPSWFYQSKMSGLAEITRRYPTERRPELYADLTAPQAKKQAPPDAERRAELITMVNDGRCRWS